MSVPTLTFKLLGHTKRADGLIGRYHLEVTDPRSDRTVTIATLHQLGCMKRILLDRCMFYRPTRASHDQVPLEILIHSQTQPKNSLVRRAFSYLPDAKSPARSWAYLLLLPHL